MELISNLDDEGDSDSASDGGLSTIAPSNLDEEGDSDSASDGRLSTIAPSVIITDLEDTFTHIERQAIAEWVDDPLLSDQDRLARRITTIARLGLVSCNHHLTPRKRRQPTSGRRSSTLGRDGRCGLDTIHARMDIYEEWKRDLPNLGLQRQEDLTLLRKRYPSRALLPKADMLHSIGSTISSSNMAPNPQISLDVDHNQATRIHRVKFDVDSFLNIVPDIGNFNDTINYTPTRQPARKLLSNVHMTYPITNLQTRVQDDIALHKIPHAYFGTIQSQTIYIFFPGLYWATRSRVSSQNGATQLTDDEHRMFYDQIMSPSIQDSFPESMTGHIEITYHAILNKAKFSSNPTARRVLPPFSFSLPFSQLHKLSAEIRENVNDIPRDPEADKADNTKTSISMMKDFFFLIDTKNTKVQHGGARDAKSCLTNFWSTQSKIIDEALGPPDQLTKDSPQLLDLAVEWSPGMHMDATILLARTCCQVNTLIFLYGGVEAALLGKNPPAEPNTLEEPSTVNPQQAKIPGGRHHFYNVNLLRDTVSATTEPASSIRRLGLHYFQSYTVGKEVLDAAGKKPYAKDELLHGGYADSTMVRMLSKSSERITSRKEFDQLLHKSHRFFLDSIESNEERHFSWRAEWRCSSHLAKLVASHDQEWLKHLAFTKAIPRPPPNGPFRKPLPISNCAFFCIPSETYWPFVRRSIKFYAYVMDLIVIHHQHETTPPTAALLYATMVTLAKSFIDPVNPRFRYVLFSPHQISNEPRAAPADNANGAGADGVVEKKKGLGLQSTIDKRGFGFLPQDLVDWKALCMHKSMMHNFSIPGLQTSIGKNKFMPAKDSPDSLFSHLMDLVETTNGSAKMKVILTATSHLILRQYRKAALESMICRNRPVLQQARIDKDQITFAFPDLEHYIQECGQTAIRSGSNRSRWRTLDDLWCFTWEDIPHNPSLGPSRKQAQTSFKDQDWRRFWRNACATIGKRVRGGRRDSSDWLSSFKEIHRRLFFYHHTTFPYPSENGGLSKPGNTPLSRALLSTVFDARDNLKLSLGPKEPSRKAAPPIPFEYRNIWSVEDIQRLVDRTK